MDIFGAKIVAKKMKETNAIKKLNKKWKGKIPRRGTKEFDEYKSDVEEATQILEECIKILIK